jgi:hypothetical protein
MKFLKCVIWFLKEHANIGIALALFLLLSLQIEKQYRSTRYFDNCLSQKWQYAGKPVKRPFNAEHLQEFALICQKAIKLGPEAFDYFKGRTHKYIIKYN